MSNKKNMDEQRGSLPVIQKVDKSTDYASLDIVTELNQLPFLKSTKNRKDRSKKSRQQINSFKTQKNIDSINKRIYDLLEPKYGS